MRKVIAVSILSLFPLLVSDVRVSTISDKKEAMDRVVWERLVHAICMVESGCDDSARNPKSSASGRFQMLKIYVDEVNRIKGKRTYSYNDRFDPLKARERCLKFTNNITTRIRILIGRLFFIEERFRRNISRM